MVFPVSDEPIKFSALAKIIDLLSLAVMRFALGKTEEQIRLEIKNLQFEREKMASSPIQLTALQCFEIGNRK